MLVRPESITTLGHIIADATSAANISLRFTMSEIRLTLNNTQTVSKGVSNNAWQLVTFRYDGANLQLGVNEAPGASGGSTTAAYSTAIASLANAVRVGGNIGGAFFNGQIAELALSDQAFDDATFARVQAYANARYALSL